MVENPDCSVRQRWRTRLRKACRPARRNLSRAHRAATPTVRLPEQRAELVAGARLVRPREGHAGMVVAGLLPYPNFEKTLFVESVPVFVFP